MRVYETTGISSSTWVEVIREGFFEEWTFALRVEGLVEVRRGKCEGTAYTKASWLYLTETRVCGAERAWTHLLLNKHDFRPGVQH